MKGTCSFFLFVLFTWFFCFWAVISPELSDRREMIGLGTLRPTVIFHQLSVFNFHIDSRGWPIKVNEGAEIQTLNRHWNQTGLFAIAAKKSTECQLKCVFQCRILNKFFFAQENNNFYFYSFINMPAVGILFYFHFPFMTPKIVHTIKNDKH